MSYIILSLLSQEDLERRLVERGPVQATARDIFNLPPTARPTEWQVKVAHEVLSCFYAGARQVTVEWEPVGWTSDGHVFYRYVVS